MTESKEIYDAGEPRAIDLPLRVDNRGWLMATDGAMAGMGISYAYATCCWPGAVKAWHRHREHIDRLLCVSGLARIVLADEHPWKSLAGLHETKPTYRVRYQFISGPLVPRLVVVPPGWWHGFEALGGEPCVIMNCPDQPYDPADEERLDPDAIPFEWGRDRG